MSLESEEHGVGRLDFLGIGAQKGGTTSLRACLASNPLIQIADTELHFFDDEQVSWPVNDWSHYNRRHSERSFHQLAPACRGEITPIYLYWQSCPQRVYSYNPGMQLVIILRNPIARAYSHWCMERSRKKDSLTFAAAIRAEDERLAEHPNGQHRVYSYAARGRYHEQLQRWLKLFPRDQMLIARSEDFFHRPEKILMQVSRFLRVPFHLPPKMPHEMAGVYSEPMSRPDWDYLYSKLATDIEDLEKLLGWDCVEWKTPWLG